MAKIDKQISKLLNQGLSGSAIAKRLHKRKQTVLNAIREIQNKPINPKKITNPKGKIGSVELGTPSQAFTEALYSQGYSEKFIVKLVNAKHPETSQRKIRAYIRQYKKNNPEAVAERKRFQADVRRQGKQYAKNRANGKYYRETRQYYTAPVNRARYPEGEVFEEDDI